MTTIWIIKRKVYCTSACALQLNFMCESSDVYDMAQLCCIMDRERVFPTPSLGRLAIGQKFIAKDFLEPDERYQRQSSVVFYSDSSICMLSFHKSDPNKIGLGVTCKRLQKSF